MTVHPRVAGLLFGLGLFATAARADDAANAKARLEAARKVYQGMMNQLTVDINARVDSERFYQWSRRWMEAECDLATKKEDRIAAAERHLERMKKTEALVKRLVESGQAFPVNVPAQTYFRLEAERALQRARKE